MKKPTPRAYKLTPYRDGCEITVYNMVFHGDGAGEGSAEGYDFKFHAGPMFFESIDTARAYVRNEEQKRTDFVNAKPEWRYSEGIS